MTTEPVPAKVESIAVAVACLIRTLEVPQEGGHAPVKVPDM